MRDTPSSDDREVESRRYNGKRSDTDSSVYPSIDGYVFERQIGRGGSATVYLARELKHDRLVAVKVLHSVLVASIQAERFLREIAIIARLAHPNILPLLDSGRVGDTLYYVTPYVPGESLRKRLERERRLPTESAVRLTREVAEALDYAHRQGLVHRDVKPENVLLADGHALVADFGIARAISLAADDRLTTAGMAIGTPHYMSPEQGMGKAPLDGRSDVYSLGCVLFEMLSGYPPFTGETAQDVVAQHSSAEVPSLRDVSPPVPTLVDRAVRSALAKRPQDRFSSASQFAEALVGRVLEERRTLGLQRVGQWVALRRTPVLATVALGVGATFVASRMMDERRATEVNVVTPPDTTRLAVFALPAQGRGGGMNSAVDLLYEAIARWNGVTLVDQFQVSDALARSGGALTVANAARLAATLGAGRYILLQSTAEGDSARAYATLYGAPDAKHLATSAQMVRTRPDDAANAFARMARDLLLRGAGGDSTVLVGASRQLPAVQAFGVAHLALAQWDLSAADSGFQSALGFDPKYVRASYWLAQVKAWRGFPRDEWVSLAERAAESSEELSLRERGLAVALVHLGNGRFWEACAVYRSMRNANERDFAAWYGLGQCHSRDRIVVRDSSSPSGWRMRSSYHTAVTAYDRALELLPSAHAGYEHDGFEGLRALLMVGTRLFPGRGVGPDSGAFLARIAKRGDTLALVPYPWPVVTAGGGIPPGHAEALNDRLHEFRRLAGVWSAAFPQRVGPKYAIAIALEMLGDRRAIDTIALARRLAVDDARRAELAGTEAILRLKFADYSATRELETVRQLADSLLGALTTASDAAALAPLAAISGRCNQAELLSRRKPIEGSPPLTGSLAAAADLHLSRAAIGCGPGATGLGFADLVSLVNREGTALNDDSRRLLDVMALYRPALLQPTGDSAVLVRLAKHSEDPLMLAAGAIAVRDSTASRAFLNRFRALENPTQGPPSPDVALPAARFFLAVKDTTAAINVLDATLTGIRSYDQRRLREPVVAASMIRSMILRADIGAWMGDKGSARRWGGAVAVLWSRADAELQPVVRRMAGYARMR
jgi:eukaryotic-like serine/threonine-protein kinase